MKVVILVCAGLEWRSLKSLYNPPSNEIMVSPFGEYYEIQRDVILFRAGVGKTLSSAATQHAIDFFKPDLIFNFGTCGGVAPELKPHDILLATKTVQYDCIERMQPENSPFWSNMIVEIDNSWFNPSQGLIQGIIATADQDLSPENTALLRRHSVLGVDWESGAIAKICFLNKVRCCIIRGVTDTAEKGIETQANDYRANTPILMKKCMTDIFPAIMSQV